MPVELAGASRVPVAPLAMPSASHEFVLRESGVREPIRAVVRDSAAWAAQWRAIAGGYEYAAEPPRVDFRRHMVLVAALGFASPMGGRRPQFVAAGERGDTLAVALRVVDCSRFEGNDGGDAPVALATVAQRPGPVRFVEERVEPANCERR